MSFQLRDYQQQAVDRAFASINEKGNDLLVLATGAGKSIVVAEIANRLQKEVLVLQPSKEILEQNFEKLTHFVPRSEMAVYSASLNSKRIRKYTFATIGSIYKKPYLFDHIGLILLDEAHGHNLKNKDGMYSSFFSAIGNPKVIGLTATPYRNVQGYHTDKVTKELFSSVTLKLINRMKPDAKTDKFWNRILVNVGIGDLIKQGYLCPLKYESHTFLTHEEMKLNKSETEFDLEDFGVKLGSKQTQVVRNVIECEQRFKSVLVFCPSVSSATKYASATAGAAVVSAKTPAHERDRIIRDFKAGRIKTVYNMGVLTTGFDHPELDCIVLLRPTRSLALYMQMLGRGVRLAEGKTHCTIVDWTNTVEQLGCVESVELRYEKFPEFQTPQWELYSITAKGEERWHNRPLYKFKIKEGKASGYMHRRYASRGW